MTDSPEQQAQDAGPKCSHCGRQRQQAAEQMREECAKACDAERVRYATVMLLENHAHAAKVCARSVRALKLTGGAK